MNTNKRHKAYKKQFYYRILITILFVSVTPVIISSAVSYYRSRDTLRETIYSNNTSMLNKLRDEIDSQLNTAYKEILYFTIYNDNISYFLQHNSDFNGSDFIVMDQLLDDVQASVSRNSLLYDMIVCVRNQPYLLTVKGSYYYDYFANFTGNEQLADIIGLDGRSDNPSLVSTCEYYYIEHMAYPDNKQEPLYKNNVLCIHFSLPYSAQKRTVSVTALLNTDFLSESLRWSGITDMGIVAIISDDGRVITHFDNNSGRMQQDIEALGALAAEKTSGNNIIGYAGDSYVTTVVGSSIEGLAWNYAVFIPEAEIQDKLSPLTRLNIIIVAGAMLAGFIWAYFTSRSIYHPLEGIFGLFGNKSSPARDEISYLSGNIKRVILENDDLQRQLMDLLPIYQEKALSDLLHRQTDEPHSDSAILQGNLRMPLEHFRTIIVIDKGNALSMPLLEEMFERLKVNHYCLNEDGLWIAVMNYTCFNQSALRNIFSDLSVALCVGGQYDQICHISKSYNEAQFCLRYHTLGFGFELVSYEALRTAEPYPVAVFDDFKAQFGLLVSQSGYDQAAEAARQYISDTLTGATPAYTAIILMDEVYEMLKRKCMVLGLDYNEILMRNYQYHLPARYFSLQSRQSYMISMVERFISAVKSCERQPVPFITEQIIEYINKNITRDISLEDLSRHFYLSYSYMSSLFKNYTDKGFKDYLNSMRIQRAKELFAEKHLTVQKIAEMVGYSSALTFTRNFKKYMNMTPGAYQESVRYKMKIENGEGG